MTAGLYCGMHSFLGACSIIGSDIPAFNRSSGHRLCRRRFSWIGYLVYSLFSCSHPRDFSETNGVDWYDLANLATSLGLTYIYTVPVIIIPLSLLAVSVHPDPADNCPCFEDAIAFIAVAVGVNLGQWGVYRASARCALATRGTKLLGTPWGILLWLSTCIAKIVVGITCILLWRIAAKTTLCAILPPIFRAFNPILNLPRRFYQPAK